MQMDNTFFRNSFESIKFSSLRKYACTNRFLIVLLFLSNVPRHRRIWKVSRHFSCVDPDGRLLFRSPFVRASVHVLATSSVKVPNNFLIDDGAFRNLFGQPGFYILSGEERRRLWLLRFCCLEKRFQLFRITLRQLFRKMYYLTSRRKIPGKLKYFVF